MPDDVQSARSWALRTAAFFGAVSLLVLLPELKRSSDVGFWVAATLWILAPHAFFGLLAAPARKTASWAWFALALEVVIGGFGVGMYVDDVRLKPAGRIGGGITPIVIPPLQLLVGVLAAVWRWFTKGLT